MGVGWRSRVASARELASLFICRLIAKARAATARRRPGSCRASMRCARTFEPTLGGRKVRNNRNASVRLEQSRDHDAGGWRGAPLSFLRNIGWGARDTIALAVGVTGSVAILVNALFLQSGPHPAPLFKASSAPVAASEATNTVAVAVPRARPPEPVPTKLDVP